MSRCGSPLILVFFFGGLSSAPAADKLQPMHLIAAAQRPAVADSLFSGVVVDSKGLPALTTTVWLVGGSYDKDPVVIAKGATDAQGRFSFQGLTQQKLFDNNARLPQLFARDAKGRLGWSHAYRKETLDEEKIQIKLFEVGAVRGRVLDASGAPVANARITPLYLTGPQTIGFSSATGTLFPELAKDYIGETSDDGSFMLIKLPTIGRVMAHVSAPGFGTPRVSWDSRR